MDNHPYAIKIYMKNAMESDDELGLENEVIIMSQVELVLCRQTIPTSSNFIKSTKIKTSIALS